MTTTKPARLYAHGRALDVIPGWRIASIDFSHEMSHDGMIHTELPGGITFSTKAGGTCDRCGMSIQNLITLESAAATCIVGEDCAEFLEMPKAARKQLAEAMRAHRRAMAKAQRKRTRVARKAERPAPPPLADADRVALGRLAEGPEGFGKRFAESVIGQGRALTAAQRSRMEVLLVALDAPPSPSQHVGTIGARLDTEAQVTFTRAFGHRWLVVMADVGGNVIVTWADWCTLELGDRISVRGKVRAHGIRNGVLQTELGRCALEKLAIPA